MYCVIQEVKLKKPVKSGASKDLKAKQDYSRDDLKHWGYSYSIERFERLHQEAYRFSIHESYREDGKIKKRQYYITTIDWYTITEFGFYDCVYPNKMEDIAGKLNISVDDLYDLIYEKFDPLQARIEAEYQQSDEYKTHKRHQKILIRHKKAEKDFEKKYGSFDYEYCYDIFGNVVNQAYLDQITAASKKRNKSYRQQFREEFSGYYGGQQNNYSSGYSALTKNNYSEEDKKHLKKFYRFLSAKFHPDINHDADDAGAMELLNKLKNEWGI